MALMPFTEWRGPVPASNYQPGLTRPMIGVVVHHMDGSWQAAESRFMDPSAQASAHFGVRFDGTIIQWVDTADTAYHACCANRQSYVGIENESDPNNPDGPPTLAQIAAMGRIIRWLGVTPVPCPAMGVPGVGYHRQFPGDCSVAWGQTACPGNGFINAIPAICAAAHQEPDDMTPDQAATLSSVAAMVSKIENAIFDPTLGLQHRVVNNIPDQIDALRKELEGLIAALPKT